MAKQILQINFTYSVSESDLAKAFDPIAQPVSKVPGLLWKIWLLDPARKESGGIHLFEDSASLQKYLQGDIIAAISKHPALSNFSVKQFGIDEVHSKFTRAPLGPIPA